MSQTTIYVDDRVAGWVNRGRCTHPDCVAARKDGRPWHATPKVGTFADYHFATEAEATAAVKESAR